MRLIDADVLKKDLSRFYDGIITARQLIDSQPTVELPKEQQPRVLAVDEIKNLPNDTDVWLETWDGDLFAFTTRIPFMEFYITKVIDGKYRMWTARPTEEQRKAELWDTH